MERSAAAFALSLVGGLFIIFGALVLFFVVDTEYFYVLVLLGGLGTIFGLIVVAGALMLYLRPQQGRFWGIIIIVISIFSIISTGGLLIGMFLGIIGGLIALIKQGRSSTQNI